MVVELLADLPGVGLEVVALDVKLQAELAEQVAGDEQGHMPPGPRVLGWVCRGVGRGRLLGSGRRWLARREEVVAAFSVAADAADAGLLCHDSRLSHVVGG